MAEHLHFGAAARALRTAQPSLSQQIRRLEAEIGVDLFTRDRHNVQLTAAGEAFLHEARDVIARADRSMATAREAAAGRIGRLRIGCAFGSLDQRFGARLAAFSRECPSIALEVRTVSGADAIEGLLRETIDIALTPALLPQEADACGISQQPFARERVVLIASQSHFPKTQRLALADVRERRLLLPARHFDGPLHDAIRQAFREAPLSTTNVQEVVDAPSLIGLASAGVGIGVGPACWHLFATPDTLFLSATPETFVEYAFQFRIDVGNPTLRTFVDFLRED